MYDLINYQFKFIYIVMLNKMLHILCRGEGEFDHVIIITPIIYNLKLL